MLTWLPISDAPKDGRELVVTDFTGPPEFANWKDSTMYMDGGFWSNRDNRRREVPTHFLDLSLLPKPDGTGRRGRAEANRP